MRCILLLLALSATFLLRAQIRCAPAAGVADHQLTPGKFLSPLEHDHAISDLLPASPAAVIRIPVVVHVLYQLPAQNISDAQIFSGIAALNRDMRRRNADTLSTPKNFRRIAADMEIEFVLATTDPAGNATSGIVRKPTAIKEWSADDKIKLNTKGGSNAWDTRRYLNIWIGNMPRSLGYGTVPGGNANADGVVITTSAFGTLGNGGPYNKGRTLVHEVGHWLGLKHIWGDESCGDDGIPDTPKQAGFTSGCPSGIVQTCDNGPDGDMYMNFMDFTNDACMNLFTLGQKAKARSLFAPGGLRHSMLAAKDNSASTGMWPETVADAVPAIEPEPTLVMYPNPATQWLMVTGPKQVTGKLQVANLFGRVVYAAAYNGAPLQIATATWPPGVYQVTLLLADKKIMGKLVRTSVQ